MIALVRYRVEKGDKWQDEEVPIPENIRNDDDARGGVVSDFLQDKHGKHVNWFSIRDYKVCATIGCVANPKKGYPHCKNHILSQDKPDYKKYK